MQTANFLENLVNAKLTPFLFGALGWTFAWQLQLLIQQLIPALGYDVGVSLIFLPAGIRTLAVLVFGFRGAVGVFCGCIFSTIDYMGHLPSLDAFMLLIICAISAFSAYLMMQLVCWWRKIGHDLEELQFSDVLFIVFSQGLLSASLHQLVFAKMNLEGVYNNPSTWDTFRLWAAMATGDIVGSMVFMLSAIALANIATRLLRVSRQD